MEELQKNLVNTYHRLKKILKNYENPLVSKFDLDSKYDLWSIKNIKINGKQKKEIYFAGLIIQSNYVGFYYMPIYTDIQLKKLLKPDLLRLLKGKSCFHIKKMDENLEKQIDKALKQGYELYKKKSWI